jgi:hypothetical protein
MGDGMKYDLVLTGPNLLPTTIEVDRFLVTVAGALILQRGTDDISAYAPGVWAAIRQHHDHPRPVDDRFSEATREAAGA